MLLFHAANAASMRLPSAPLRGVRGLTGERFAYVPLDANLLHGLTYACVRDGDWLGAYSVLATGLIQNLPGQEASLGADGAVASVGVWSGERALASALGGGTRQTWRIPGLTTPALAALAHFITDRVDEAMDLPGGAGEATLAQFAALRANLVAQYGDVSVTVAEAAFSALADRHEALLEAEWSRDLGAAALEAGGELDDAASTVYSQWAESEE